MMSNKLKHAALASVLVIGAVQQATAQDIVGVRASGMAGAFVAVADDASGVYWNPAGLATGAYVSFVLDYGEAESLPERAILGGGAARRTARMVALSTPPAGFAYYRQDVYTAGPWEPVVAGVPDREEVGRSVHAVRASTYGATALQSLGQYIVVGTTLKLVRLKAVSGTTAAANAKDGLDAAAGLSATDSDTKGDLDVGVMMAVAHVRLGVVARNLRAPTFQLGPEGSLPVELERQVQVGGAWGSGWPGKSRVVLAFNADLTDRVAIDGERRDMAAGVETWWRAQRLGLRAGVRRSMTGESRQVLAAGASAGLTAGMFLEGHVARGSPDDRSWSVGARFTF